MIDEIDHGFCLVHRLNGTMHLPNGPAVAWADGGWEWYLFNNWHRYYGPSRRFGDWWIHNKKIK
jgi:hypothetical protein